MGVRAAPRDALTAAALVLLALAAAAVNLVTGTVELSVGQVLDTLGGRGSESDLLVVREVRLPRVVTGVVAGAAFGVAGALTQTLFRNDLASPDVIGVQTGAALAAVIVFTNTAASATTLAFASFAGGLVFAALVWVLSASGRRFRIEHVLIGVAVAAMGEAGIAYLLRRADIDDLRRAAVWLAGDLTGVTVAQTQLVTALVLALLVGVAMIGASWRQLQLGDDLATTLGARIGAVRVATAVLAVALVSVVTAVTGPIAFVALVAPHIGRRLAGTAAPSLWLAGAAGAALVSVADVSARSLISLELPVGVVTTAIGAPVLVWLLVRGRAR